MGKIWNFYVAEEARYDGGAEMSLNIARQRLAQGNVIPTKEWIYWFTAICSDDVEGVKEFFSSIDPVHPGLSQKMNDIRTEIKEYLLRKYLGNNS